MQKTFGLQTRREVRLDPTSQKRHADTFVFDWDRGVSCAQDWVVCHLMTSESLKQQCMNPDWALQHAEVQKIRKEAGFCESHGMQFLPLAIDTFGGLSLNAQSAIARVANEGRVFRNNEEKTSSKRMAQKLRLVALRGLGYQIVRRQMAQGMPDDGSSEAYESKLITDLKAAVETHKYTSPPAGQPPPSTERGPDWQSGECLAPTVAEKPGESRQNKQELRPPIEVIAPQPSPQETISSSNKQSTLSPPSLTYVTVLAAEEMVSSLKWSLSTAASSSRTHPVSATEVWAFLEAQWHLRPVELGQGRGGECQFISLMFADNPLAFSWHNNAGWVAQYQKVDAFRLAIRKWLEENGDNLIGDIPLRIMALPPSERSTPSAWPSFLDRIQKGGWGDSVSLVAAAAVLRRSIVVISLSSDVGVHELVPSVSSKPFNPVCDPILLFHRSESHYCPLLTEKQWSWVQQHISKSTQQPPRDKPSFDTSAEQEEVLSIFRPCTNIETNPSSVTRFAINSGKTAGDALNGPLAGTSLGVYGGEGTEGTGRKTPEANHLGPFSTGRQQVNRSNRSQHGWVSQHGSTSVCTYLSPLEKQRYSRKALTILHRDSGRSVSPTSRPDEPRIHRPGLEPTRGARYIMQQAPSRESPNETRTRNSLTGPPFSQRPLSFHDGVNRVERVSVNSTGESRSTAPSSEHPSVRTFFSPLQLCKYTKSGNVLQREETPAEMDQGMATTNATGNGKEARGATSTSRATMPLVAQRFPEVCSPPHRTPTEEVPVESPFRLRGDEPLASFNRQSAAQSRAEAANDDLWPPLPTHNGPAWGGTRSQVHTRPFPNCSNTGPRQSSHIHKQTHMGRNGVRTSEARARPKQVTLRGHHEPHTEFRANDTETHLAFEVNIADLEHMPFEAAVQQTHTPCITETRCEDIQPRLHR